MTKTDKIAWALAWAVTGSALTAVLMNHYHAQNADLHLSSTAEDIPDSSHMAGLSKHGDVPNVIIAIPSTSKKTPKLHLRKVQDFYVKVTAYSPTSDSGDPYRKRFSSANFLPGGRLYDSNKPYPSDYTRLSKAMQNKWKVVAIPRWARRYHETLMPFKMSDGREVWFHKYKIEIPGYGVAMPLDRITSRDRFDILLYTSNKEARKWGVQSLKISIYEWVYE